MMVCLPESLSAESLLSRTVRGIRGADATARESARARQQVLTKPEGSLGLLEDLSIRLAGMYGQVPVPVPSHPVVGLFAGDHGVWAQGVSPDPQEITTQQMVNMAAGGAAISVMSRNLGAQLWITDVGARHEVDAPIRQRCVRRGTDDISQGPAMSLDEALRALEVGIETGLEAVEQGADILVTGEMGIANTTPAAALISVFTRRPPAEVTGRGAGSDDRRHQHKIGVVSRAIQVNRPEADRPVEALAKVGGFEHAAMAGFILAAASSRIPVLIDGVIACSAALTATAICPQTRDFIIMSHAGAEPGIAASTSALDLPALLDLGMRLGEGSGAILALPIVQASAHILNEMATFEDADVTDIKVTGETDIPDAIDVDATEEDASEGKVPCRALVLGGARSGKSTFAESRLPRDSRATYVATSQRNPDDAEWEERIRLHQSRRPATWQTVETTDIAAVLLADDDSPVLVDCLGVWITRILDEVGAWSADPGDQTWQTSVRNRVDDLTDAIRRTRRDVTFVSNEVGMGVVPDTAAGRLFRDELGRLNAAVADACDEVWMCVAGIPKRWA
ncbi:nicotinate-nucleotide--dimethylbenzimidazole phosphoribosyltransferase [Cutibacterium equinum]|uniref:Nicotinate-nucleotide--dimethylbenzimidazole phosphoribosyltransferase n=1 Tax=Cutibacterium equinum TaxID=3016342 RepID=A0ABY7QZ75_9ACTN|nr:nicotinate-nucleotide--dimethylbenzimidazole phosphoribosyltransferase [Cutibacterium equinum]WCC80331.1 nicotinate-nucleotide--dimethylbenzimidazole phosphoribosyltransferase [Cutibacterium equinum]